MAIIKTLELNKVEYSYAKLNTNFRD